jgi:hypothetical protein
MSSRTNSPYWAAGRIDGALHRPPDHRKAWSIMYRKGYLSGWPESGMDVYAVDEMPETRAKREEMSARKARPPQRRSA